MKHFVPLAASLLLIGSTGLAMAQYNALVAETPTVFGNPPFTVSPQVQEIAARIKLQEGRIAEGMNTGKLLLDQGTALKKKLTAIRLELQLDFRQNRKNGQQGLTDDQIKQLNSELNANLTALREDKHDSASPGTNP